MEPCDTPINFYLTRAPLKCSFRFGGFISSILLRLEMSSQFFKSFF